MKHTFIITNDSESNFFLRVNGISAIMTTRSCAKVFKSKEAAQKVLDKWNGTGVGMEFFTKIVEA